MEVLRLCLFFLQADPYPIYESLWPAPHILDNLLVSELLVGLLLLAHSCCIENVLLVDSTGSQSYSYYFLSCSSFAFASLILVSISFISCSRSVLSASSSFLYFSNASTSCSGDCGDVAGGYAEGG